MGVENLVGEYAGWAGNVAVSVVFAGVAQMGQQKDVEEDIRWRQRGS